MTDSLSYSLPRKFFRRNYMSIKGSVFFDRDCENRNKFIEELGNYIIENNSTVRKTAEKFGISKSTVHKDLTVHLKEINVNLYEDVEKLLQKNKSERHLRGGLATKMKYLNTRKCIKKQENINRQQTFENANTNIKKYNFT